jgi:alkyl hydroperoxide reductase subunit AhpF
MSDEQQIFDDETWAQLPSFIEHLPEPLYLIVWGDENASQREKETARLCRTLADHFDVIQFQMLPQRINYPYWPVIGVMRGTQEKYKDVGVRLVGLPAGYQMTSFITAMQAVAFQGSTMEAKTRIQLHKLADDVTLELVTAVDDEAGALMAQPIFNMAAVNSHIRAHLIMGDNFPQALWKYSVYDLPHLVINGRVHVAGVVDEETIVQHIAKAVKG